VILQNLISSSKGDLQHVNENMKRPGIYVLVTASFLVVVSGLHFINDEHLWTKISWDQFKLRLPDKFTTAPASSNFDLSSAPFFELACGLTWELACPKVQYRTGAST
jgi:hypothetical protein